MPEQPQIASTISPSGKIIYGDYMTVAVFNLEGARYALKYGVIEEVWCIDRESQPYRVACVKNYMEAVEFYNK